LLLLPKILILILLVLAVFDPAWSTTERKAINSSALVLLDTSSSMDVKDDGVRSRRARAREVLEEMRNDLAPRMSVKAMAFDTTLRELDETGEAPASTDPAAEAGLRGTDLAGCLVSLSERADLSSYAAVVLLTDGGDEVVESAVLPPVPLHIVGFGTAPEQWNDVVVSDVRCPPSVEKDVAFEVDADILAHCGSDPSFAKGLFRVVLEKEADGNRQEVAGEWVDLSNRRARVRFRVSAGAAGYQAYRIAVQAVPGEASTLNNSRAFGVEVRRKSLHVLFFTRELGADLKMIRNELASDPGVTFTALFRTIGERFTVQGQRLPGDEELDAGFPSSPDVLRLFDCVVVGSFPATEWREEQMAALVDYVEGGGAVVFLGGDASFGRGGYASTTLAPLFPWEIAGDEPEMMRGEFPVSIPAAAVGEPIVADLPELVGAAGQPLVGALNAVGRVKPGATALMHARVGTRVVPLVAIQRFGKGKTLAIASNMLWTWARQEGSLQRAYGLFWRQAARELAGQTEGGRILSVKWDKDTYRPGERAEAEIRTAGERVRHDVRLTASLSGPDETRQLPVEPIQGQPGLSAVRMVFGRRGMYRVKLTAYRDEEAVESYEKVFMIAPGLAEGTRLEVDETFLSALAQRAAGRFFREKDAGQLIDYLRGRNLEKTIVSDLSLIHGQPYFAVLFLSVLVAEWALRRKMNLF